MCTTCSCSTETSTTDSATPADHAGHRGEFTVVGMTCGHCVSSVTEELQELDAVREVEVDLATGALTVHSDQPVSAEAVAMAVREAGYQLA